MKKNQMSVLAAIQAKVIQFAIGKAIEQRKIWLHVPCWFPRKYRTAYVTMQRLKKSHDTKANCLHCDETANIWGPRWIKTNWSQFGCFHFPAVCCINLFFKYAWLFSLITFNKFRRHCSTEPAHEQRSESHLSKIFMLTLIHFRRNRNFLYSAYLWLLFTAISIRCWLYHAEIYLRR